MLTPFFSLHRHNLVEQWIQEVVSIDAPSLVVELTTLISGDIQTLLTYFIMEFLSNSRYRHGHRHLSYHPWKAHIVANRSKFRFYFYARLTRLTIWNFFR
uniref:Uncharacterized protein n=1 Tax=Solanum lycopersicum TaxID=4081 RepID=A0A3Q7G7I5_SOLLC